MLNNAQEYIGNKYHFDFTQKPAFVIPGGRGEGGLATLLKELDVKTGVEIGVLKGEYTQILLQSIPGLKLYGVDPWIEYPDYYDVSGGQKYYDEIYEEAKQRTKDYDCTLIKKFSMDAVKDFEDESLDFVYIDGNHEFIHVAEDIHYWSKKVKPGGIISGHDYRRGGFKSKCQVNVKDVIHAYTYTKGRNIWFIISGDHHQSWMWVK